MVAPMIEKTKQSTWLSLVAWVLLSSASVLLGFLVLRILVDPAGGKGNPFTSSVLAAIAFGMLLPLGQWTTNDRPCVG